MRPGCMCVCVCASLCDFLHNISKLFSVCLFAIVVSPPPPFAGTFIASSRQSADATGSPLRKLSHRAAQRTSRTDSIYSF